MRGALRRRVAGMLGSARADALTDLRGAARNLLLGRARPTPEDPAHALRRRARESLVAGDYERVSAEADWLVQAASQLRREAARHRGDVAAVARAMGEAQRVTGGAQLTREERAWLGRAITSDERWIPWLPTIARRPEPRDRVVLHLLEESLPHITNERTRRVHALLLEERDAGLEPVAVTSLGFPRWIGLAAFEPFDAVDGIRYFRLDAGPAYDVETPADVYLADYAWLAARLAERLRPAVLHATIDATNANPVAIGRALRARLGVPLVCEVASAAIDTAAVLRDANAVVVPDDRTRDALAEAGLPRTIPVIPGTVRAGGPSRTGERYRALYESLLGSTPDGTPASADAAVGPRSFGGTSVP